MAESWDTKWGSRKVRYDPPTLTEAIAAAQGLSDDINEQAEIAAGLIGASIADVKAEMQKTASDRRTVRTVTAPSRDKGLRTVVVERKASRRITSREKAPL